MSELFLVPVGQDWVEEYERTVASPLELEGDVPSELAGRPEVRVWGTTAGSKKKRTTFESMAPEDPVLFLHEGEFVGSARVEETFENSDLGEWLWGTPESRFIYTLADYQEISIPRSEIWDLLDYSPNYPLYGFSRASDDALSSLLQSYNSVEEAFQSLREDEVDDASDENVETPEELTNDIRSSGETVLEESGEVREHTEIQWYLIQLGLEHGYDVYVATNDQNLTYEGQRLGEDCVDSLNLTGFSDAAMRLIEYVDVIWLNGDYIEKMFEGESTTSIFSGILRMTDFAVKVPNLAVDMHIVAPEADEDQVRRQIDRPTFQHVMGEAKHCSLQYLSFEAVREKREVVSRAGPLKQVF